MHSRVRRRGLYRKRSGPHHRGRRHHGTVRYRSRRLGASHAPHRCVPRTALHAACRAVKPARCSMAQPGRVAIGFRPPSWPVGAAGKGRIAPHPSITVHDRKDTIISHERHDPRHRQVAAYGLTRSPGFSGHPPRHTMECIRKSLQPVDTAHGQTLRVCPGTRQHLHPG